MRRVGAEPPPAPAAVERAVAAVLDRRLSARSPRPVALALSGGGDSVALLLAAHRWAQARGRPLVALTVDHRLQPESAAWTRACADLAARLGTGFHACVWQGAKPQRGVPAAARAARQRLLAEAARAAGARVILTGHTADDVAEARAMRAAGSTTPDPREWSPSPAWPEGRGVFLLRPLLGSRRAALRRWLEALGESWIDDPANADLRYARPRARAALAAADAPAPGGEEAPARLDHRSEPWAEITAPRAALRAAPPAAAERFVGLACVCAGGGARLPSAAARARLAAALRGAGPVAATLAGARVRADAETVRITREAGEARRRGLAPLALTAGETAVWDGRFEVTASAPGLTVVPLAGLARKLPPDQRRALAALPTGARPSLPAIVEAAGGVSCPLLGVSPARAASLVADRLRAAAGLVLREPD